MAAVAFVATVGAGYAGAQTAPPAKPKTVEKKATPTKEAGEKAEKKEAGEKEEAAEAKLQLKDLPPAVRTTVEAETKNATLKGLSKEKANGKTVYEVETLVNGRTRDLMVDAAGKVYEVEEQLDAARAPVPVKAALEAQGQIVVLESVTTNGKVHYEGQVKTKAGKTVSLELDADGKPIKQ
jgi:uncharacterized membrane protein YkoI